LFEVTVYMRGRATYAYKTDFLPREVYLKLGEPMYVVKPHVDHAPFNVYCTYGNACHPFVYCVGAVVDLDEVWPKTTINKER
jgi:hypothetical protein